MSSTHAAILVMAILSRSGFAEPHLASALALRSGTVAAAVGNLCGAKPFLLERQSQAAKRGRTHFEKHGAPQCVGTAPETRKTKAPCPLAGPVGA